MTSWKPLKKRYSIAAAQIGNYHKMLSVKAIGHYHILSLRPEGLELPEGLERMGFSPFEYSLLLRRVAIPVNCVIGMNAVQYCSNLRIW